MGIELKNLKPIAFSFGVSLVIAFIFLMATFFVLAYSGPDAMKDALSTTGSYFGAASTLGTAIIAAYLFNDWKDQHNKEIINKFSIQTYDSFNNLSDSISEFNLLIAKIEIPEKKFGWVFSKEFKQYINEVDELFLKQKQIDDCFFQFLSRLREYGMVTNEISAVNNLHQEFIKLFDVIMDIKFSNSYELNETVNVFEKRYRAYSDLKTQIIRKVIHPLLSNLQAN